MNKLMELKVDLVLKSENPIKLNGWTGSTLRGALSHRMMKRYCKNKVKDCATCNNNCTCCIGVLFNTAKQNSKELTTNPIVINSNYENGRVSNEIKCNMVLFGNGTMFLQNIIMELTEGIEIGHTKELFKLESANYTGTNEELVSNGVVCSIKFCDTQPIKADNQLKITFESPWAAKKSFDELSFTDFIRACLIRTMAVYNTVGIPLDMDYHGLLDKSASIKRVQKEIESSKAIRYSSRRKSVMNIPVITGELVYEGELTEFLPYIAVAQEFNIGKMCSMGLGKFTANSGG